MGLGKLFCEPILSSKNGLKTVSYSAFYDEPEKLSWKVLSRNTFKKKEESKKSCQIICFRPKKKVEKTHSTHILDRLEILYRMV
jgi:hypothetical protein